MTYVDKADLASNAIGQGASLVGLTSGIDVQQAIDARVNLMDYIDPALHAAIFDGTYAYNDPAYDVTPAFEAAFAEIMGRPNGGQIVIPPGYYTMDVDLSATSTDFDHTINIRGSGRGSTIIRPTGAGTIVVNMLGRNRVTLADLTIASNTGYPATCAIYVARQTYSPNANNNKFLNVEIIGPYSGPAVVSCAAESSLWFNCRFAPDRYINSEGINPRVESAKIAFWTGIDASQSGVLAPGGTVPGPNTDNRMIACEIIMPYDGAKGMLFSSAGSWLVDSTSFICGDASESKMVVITDLGGSGSAENPGVFSGPLHFRDCHWEVFGQNNCGIWVEGSGQRYIFDLSITKGFVNVRPVLEQETDHFAMLDYGNLTLAGGLVLVSGTFDAPAVSGGSLGATIPLRAWVIQQARIFWKTRGVGKVDVSGGTTDCLVSAGDFSSPGSDNETINLHHQSAVPDPSSSGTLDDLRNTVTALLQRLRTVGLIDA